ncbi:MAG TPA: HAD family phosphatase [Candidatus Sulfotelmatobacter sp.]|nr:HAD family phosphatase [Candidatus Sulfotelmatobacter sp.]
MRRRRRGETAARPQPAATDLPPILFDLDGTLIDSNYQHVTAWGEALRLSGIVIPLWKIHRRVGMSGKSFLRELLREIPGRKRNHDLDQLESKHDEIFRRSIAQLPPLPGANQLLKHLSNCRVPIAIATTGGRAQTSRLLRRLAVPRTVEIVTGDDVEKAKPSPDIFMAAAARLQVPIGDCIVVGDSPWDMLAAGRKSALGVALLSGGYGQEDLERAGAFRVYSDAADMLMHLEQLGFPGT